MDGTNIAGAITEPGIYDLDDLHYQEDPCEEISLRSSIAWKLADKASTPAHAAYACKRLNPDYVEEEKREFDIGKAAHRLLLGKGSEFAIVHADNYLTKKAKDERDVIRAAGKTPLLEWEAAEVRRMVAAANRQIGELIEAGTIDASPFDAALTEKVIVWRDQGVLCRAMLDGLSIDHDIVSEAKSEGQSASLDQFQWKARKLGYVFRLAFYRRGLEALKLAYSPSFHIFVMEKKPPYLLAFYRVDDELIARENERVTQAIKVWRHCLETNKWPGYPVAGFDLSLTDKEIMQEHGPKAPGAHLDSQDMPDDVYSGVSFKR
jgi:hypothetical protein